MVLTTRPHPPRRPHHMLSSSSSYPFYVYELQSPRSGRFFCLLLFRWELYVTYTPRSLCFGSLVLGFRYSFMARSWGRFRVWVWFFWGRFSPTAHRLPPPPPAFTFFSTSTQFKAILNLCNNIEHIQPHHHHLQQLRTMAKITINIHFLTPPTPSP
jgi:hypothetical protein